MIHQSILKYRNARYLWWALAVMAASIALYVTQGVSRQPSGGTWQGYTLGTVGALLIGWLTLLGVRKRAYDSNLGSVQGWTSAHVYLGTTLLLVGTLHCAARFGPNVHTVAYVLMCLVVVSGFFGMYAYLNVPRRLAENQRGGGRSELFTELLAVNGRLRSLTAFADPAVQVAVASSIERSVIGGGLIAQLAGRDRSRYLHPARAIPGGYELTDNPDQQAVIEFIAARLTHAEQLQEVPKLQQMIVLMSQRQAVIRRIRRDIRLSGWLQCWLYFHVPLSIGLVIALAVHILTTFFYW